jgi:hypothetical protein
LIYSQAIKHIRALDAAIISIIEPILNPIWVMLIQGEKASGWPPHCAEAYLPRGGIGGQELQKLQELPEFRSEGVERWK